VLNLFSLSGSVRFQVYTAKSLCVGKSGETHDDAQLQLVSDVGEGTIEAETATVNPLSSTTPRAASSFLAGLGRLQLPLSIMKMMESSEDDEVNEIEAIEIELPIIEDFGRRKYHENQNRDEDVNAAISVDVDDFTTQPAADLLTTRDDSVAFTTSSLAASNDATFDQNADEVSARAYGARFPPASSDEAESYWREESSRLEEIQSVESKLMEQWKAADESMSDLQRFESEAIAFKPSRLRLRFPFNVKIIVNNDDASKSCKTKKSCSQVRFAELSELDPIYDSADDSDEDLFFQAEPERYYDVPNRLGARNARRAADDMSMYTPAPRYPPMQALKKPGWVEQLENESSLERSERVNKGLDNLMNFVSMWAQVDKFVSDRTRGVVKKLAYLASGDDYDEPLVGSRKRVDSRRSVHDEPFT
jgi:hypothetical protein